MKYWDIRSNLGEGKIVFDQDIQTSNDCLQENIYIETKNFKGMFYYWLVVTPCPTKQL